MQITDALDIVLDLAAQNVILDSEMDVEAERQRDAIALVEQAVPELLAALKNLLAGPDWPGAQMTARAAIAKAEGK